MILDEKNTHEPDIEHGYSYEQYLYINQNIYKCLHLYYIMLIGPFKTWEKIGKGGGNLPWSNKRG